MKLKSIPLALLITLAAGHVAANDCTMPDMPSIPDGSTATMEEMIAGQSAVKAYQADVESYRGCQDGRMQALRAAVEEGDPGAAPAFEEATAAYNESVTLEEQLAERFNQAIRAYKAANPS